MKSKEQIWHDNQGRKKRLVAGLTLVLHWVMLGRKESRVLLSLFSRGDKP